MPKNRRYKKPAPLEIVKIKGKRGLFGHKVMCCDCQLVHKFYYKVLSPSEIEFAAERDERATAAARRVYRSTSKGHLVGSSSRSGKH